MLFFLLLNLFLLNCWLFFFFIILNLISNVFPLCSFSGEFLPGVSLNVTTLPFGFVEDLADLVETLLDLVLLLVYLARDFSDMIIDTDERISVK